MNTPAIFPIILVGIGIAALVFLIVVGVMLNFVGIWVRALVAKAPTVRPRGSFDDDSDLPPREDRVGYKIKQGFKHAGGTLQEFFTGRRALDGDNSGDSD